MDRKLRKEILTGKIKFSTILKHAVAFGTAAYVSPVIAALGAVIWLARRHLLKKRQKDLLLKDLKTELEIIEEKIEDAKQDGDKVKKYQYIRLRNEVKRSIEKLRYGAIMKKETERG